MSWTEIIEKFRKEFKGYEVIVRPPCISVNRETEYTIEAMRICLEEVKENRSNVIIDHFHKLVIYNR